MPEGGTIVACPTCDAGFDAKWLGCCDDSAGGVGGWICHQFCGPCAIGKLMAMKGGEGEGPQAVAEPGNCFCCALCWYPCMCCNRGKYRAQQAIEGSPVNDWLSTCLCCAWMPFFTICAMHQLINDYEIKNGGKFAVCGTYTPPLAGAPAGIEMTV